MKARRLSAILDLVDRHAITSQEDLRRHLEDHGFSATQATLSRDISELGLVKAAADGAYHRSGAEASNPELAAARLQHAVTEYLTAIDSTAQLVVLKTGRAQAQPMAEALDRAMLPEIIGTIAGEDTVLVICRTAAAAGRIVDRIGRLAQR